MHERGLSEKADQAFMAECLARHNRCKQKLDNGNHAMVRSWLERLPEHERQLCRVVLNNLVLARKKKQMEMTR